MSLDWPLQPVQQTSQSSNWNWSPFSSDFFLWSLNIIIVLVKENFQGIWVCCWLLSLKVTVPCPFPRRLSSSCVEVIGFAKSALHFIWEPLQKAVLKVQMAFTEMPLKWNIEISGAILPLEKVVHFGRHLPDLQLHFSLWGCLWRWIPCVCPYKLSPLDDTMALATRSRGTLKPRPFCLFWRVCCKLRTRAGFANLYVNWSQVSPKCKLRFE